MFKDSISYANNGFEMTVVLGNYKINIDVIEGLQDRDINKCKVGVFDNFDH